MMADSTEKKIKKPHDKHHHSWWWGVIPAVAALAILTFWLMGQFEEVFGIDPRGTWRTETITVTEMHDVPFGEPIPVERKIRWELLIDDVAGDLWLKLYRNQEEKLVGPITVDENSISLQAERSSFNGIYYTNAKRFRYHPFTKRYIDAVVRLGPGDAHSLKFERE